jgi:hypothetical protein
MAYKPAQSMFRDSANGKRCYLLEEGLRGLSSGFGKRRSKNPGMDKTVFNSTAVPITAPKPVRKLSNMLPPRMLYVVCNSLKKLY